MEHRLDLQNTRCPLALVLVKQKLLDLELDDSVHLLFSNQESMQDIRLYLDKKNLNKKVFHYQCDQNKLVISFSA